MRVGEKYQALVRFKRVVEIHVVAIINEDPSTDQTYIVYKYKGRYTGKYYYRIDTDRRVETMIRLAK